VTYIGHGLNSSSVEVVNKFGVQHKFVELEVELVLAVERVQLIPSLNRDDAIGPKGRSPHVTVGNDATAKKTARLFVLHFAASLSLYFSSKML